MALLGMSESAKGMSDAERERVVAMVVDDSAEAARRYRDANGLGFEMLSNLATARA